MKSLESEMYLPGEVQSANPQLYGFSMLRPGAVDFFAPPHHLFQIIFAGACVKILRRGVRVIRNRFSTAVYIQSCAHKAASKFLTIFFNSSSVASFFIAFARWLIIHTFFRVYPLRGFLRSIDGLLGL